MRKIISYSVSIAILIAVSPAYACGMVCADFESKAEAQAQAYFDTNKSGYKRLDSDKDGIECEALK